MFFPLASLSFVWYFFSFLWLNSIVGKTQTDGVYEQKNVKVSSLQSCLLSLDGTLPTFGEQVHN